MDDLLPLDRRAFFISQQIHRPGGKHIKRSRRLRQRSWHSRREWKRARETHLVIRCVSPAWLPGAAKLIKMQTCFYANYIKRVINQFIME
jgi:hypothetical protein